METTIIEADLNDAGHTAAVLSLIDGYARNPLGQGRPLDDDVRANLLPRLRQHPTTRVFLARQGGAFVGIAVCFVGFSTFAGRPLLNIHDIYVRDDRQGRGIGSLLLAGVEQAARASGYCKLTLEVMDGNPKARAVYERSGFKVGEAGGDAHRFMNKRL